MRLTTLTREQAQALLAKAYENLDACFHERRDWRNLHGTEHPELVANHHDALSYLFDCQDEYDATFPG